MSFADLSLKASGADGYYHPPNWDPTKQGRDAFQKSKGVNQYQMFGLIRFETPWNMYCKGCNSHIGRGVRYNAKKDGVGKYFSTKIWEFTMRCHECSGEIKIRTDPENTDYKCIAGCRRAASSLAPSKEISHPHFGKSIMPPVKKRKLEEPIDQNLKLPVMEIGEMKEHRGAIFAMTLTLDGSYMITGGFDRSCRLWNPHSQKLVKEYKGHGKTIMDIAIAPDKASFASAGEDRAVFLWNVKHGKVERRFYGHSSKVNSLTFNKDASLLLSGSYDSRVMIWDLRAHGSSKPIQVLDIFTDAVTEVLTTEYEIIVASVDGLLRVFDLRIGKLTSDTQGEPITSISLTQDRNCILMNVMNGGLRLLDKHSGELLREYTGHIHREMMIQSGFTHEDNNVFSTSEDGAIFFWDLLTAKKVHCLQASDHVATRIRYHPKQVMLFTADTRGVVKVWK